MCCGRKVLWEMVHLSACCMQCSIVMGKFVEEKSIMLLRFPSLFAIQIIIYTPRMGRKIKVEAYTRYVLRTKLCLCVPVLILVVDVMCTYLIST